MRVLISFWLGTITSLCMMPMWLKDAVGTTGQFHYIGHFFAFLVTALLFCWNAKGNQSRIARASVAAALGLFLELSECLGYHHRLEKKDVLVNTLGVVTGFLIASYFSQRRDDQPVFAQK